MGSMALSRKDLTQIAVLLAMAVAIAIHARGPQVNQVSVNEAKALMDAGAVVIDVREPGAARKEHVAGALLIPLEAMTATLPQLALYRDRPIVVYCNGGRGRGPKATDLLNKAGFSQAVNLDAGFEGWRKASMPTKSG